VSEDTILPPTRVIGMVTWEIETVVRTAQRDQPDPGGGPPGRLFVPVSIRSRVLEWGHSSRMVGHPGSTRTSSRKLTPRYLGHYIVVHVINPSAVRLKIPSSMHVHPVFYVSLLKPVSVSTLSTPAPAHPPPRVWTVKELLAVRRRGRCFRYLVDWEGYGLEDRSWVPPSYLTDPSLLTDFYRAHPEAPGR